MDNLVDYTKSIGAGGLAYIKLTEKGAESAIEKFLGKEVFLELFVKVKKNWKSDDNFLKKKFSSQSAITD